MITYIYFYRYSDSMIKIRKVSFYQSSIIFQTQRYQIQRDKFFLKYFEATTIFIDT